MNIRGKGGLLALMALMVIAALPACTATTPTEGATGQAAAESPTDTPRPTATPTLEPTPEPTATPTEVPEATPTPPVEERLDAFSEAPTGEDIALYETLLALDPPVFDRVAAAIALEGVDPASIPEPPEEPETVYQPGDIATFWVHNVDRNTYTGVEAELVLTSRHAYFWLDTNSIPLNPTLERATPADWQAAAESFDATYEAVRAVFGNEASPGIDGDPMLHILHSDRLGQVGGYFGGPDMLPSEVEEYSNEHEMFFVSIPGVGGIASAYYHSTLAHEFQHMIHENMDPDEDLWINEGLSELAQQIAGMRGDDWASAFTDDMDRSLWYWGSDGSDYGHAYLIVDYLYERFGPEFITALVAQPENGFAGVDQTLAELGYDETFDTLYGDFMAALYLNDPALADGRYAFNEAGFGRVSATGVLDAPESYTGEVNQYGIDIIRVRGDGPATITFRGAQTTTLVPADPVSGRYMWWSNRGDSSFSTLTREVDLSGVESATLSYRAWFHIETDWDYAYVMVSTDGGETWTTLPGTSSTDRDPNGSNYGHGITGRSGGHREPVWVEETVDLSDYAGQTILLRFAMVNDEGVHEEGFVIDDIAIPEIGFFDDVEDGENGWTAEGFVRIHNRVPQRWLVNAALLGPTTVVQPLEIVDGVGTLEVDLSAVDAVVLFITGQTRFTTSVAPYRVDVTPR